MRLGMGLRLSDLLKHGATGYTGTLLNGMVSYWALDEESGTRYDSVGDNDLTDNNTVGFDTGVNGNAASFVAANSESLTKASVSLPADYTVSYWYKAPAKPDSFATPFAVITTWNTQVQLFGYYSNGVLTFGVGEDGVAAASANLTYQDVDGQEWHLVVISYDSATKVATGFIDNANTASTAPLSAARYAGPSTLTVGHAGAYGYWDGQIDEVAIWSRVLTEDERAELYNAGSGFFYPFT